MDTELFLKYLSTYLFSIFKFIAGPGLGLGYGLSPLATILCTFLGVMTGVVLFSIFGLKIRNVWFRLINKKKRKVFTRRNRFLVRVWRRYGEFVLAFISPISISPLVCTLVLVLAGVRQQKIWLYMAISAAFWSTVVSLFFFFVKEQI